MQKELNILCVDDTQVSLELCKRGFEINGYTIKTANSAEEAITILRTNKIDVLLTDVVMPFISGAELAVMAKKEFPELLIMFMSASELIIKGCEEKKVEFYKKPLNFNEVLEDIYDLLDTKV